MGAPATADLPAAISAYAARFHAAVGAHQHVASRLGAYLLLGLLAPLTAGDERAALERVLGVTADDAHRAALTLLRFSLRKGSGRVDAPGGGLLGVEGNSAF